MKITYDNITIDFFDTDTVPVLPPQLVILLSGGLDSAALTYLICMHYPGIELIPYSVNDIHSPKDAIAAHNVINWLKQQFPDVLINDLVTFDFDIHDESFWPIARAYQAANPGWADFSLDGIVKTTHMNRVATKMCGMYPSALLVSGMTANPPMDEMTKHNFCSFGERRRDIPVARPLLVGKMYTPFKDVHKKFIADIYETHGLMDSLFPITKSCVGKAKMTDNFTKECNNCFWCYEKRWAFNIT